MTWASSAHGLPGVFISFEGGEGVGKTTQIRFMESVLKKAGLDVVRLREPGGTTVGENLRSIVLDAKNDMLNDRAELYIYEAARAQIVAEVIRPALERGAVVLCDRFVDSTVAYQGYGRGLDPAFVRQANEFACQGILPDVTVLLTVDSTAMGLRRATRRLGADRLELAGTEFHQRVNEGFKQIAAEHPERIHVVASTSTKSAAARAVWDAVGGVLRDAFGVEPPTEADYARLDKLRRRPGGGGGSGSRGGRQGGGNRHGGSRDGQRHEGGQRRDGGQRREGNQRRDGGSKSEQQGERTSRGDQRNNAGARGRRDSRSRGMHGGARRGTNERSNGQGAAGSEGARS